QVVVVRRDAFECPKLTRVAFARKIVRREDGGLDALDVPAMEVLVARKPEKVEVIVTHFRATARRQFVAAAEQAGARAVLEAAVAVAHHGELKQIAIERRRAVRRAAEKVNVPLTNAREIAREALDIGVLPSGERDLVTHAARGEGGKREVAHLDRMIDQRVVVLRTIAA